MKLIFNEADTKYININELPCSALLVDDTTLILVDKDGYTSKKVTVVITDFNPKVVGLWLGFKLGVEGEEAGVAVLLPHWPHEALHANLIFSAEQATAIKELVATRLVLIRPDSTIEFINKYGGTTGIICKVGFTVGNVPAQKHYVKFDFADPIKGEDFALGLVTEVTDSNFLPIGKSKARETQRGNGCAFSAKVLN